MHEVHRWFCDLALPLWVEAGWDRRVFVEQLDLDGAPILGLPRRTMVQCRQIYVMTVAARRRWHPFAAERAIIAGESLFSRFAMADGGFVFALDKDDEIIDPRVDLYTHAFVLLACAALAELTADSVFLDRADATLRFLDERMSAAEGYVDGTLARDTSRRQNPHMHLFEALLALHRCNGTRGYLDRASNICSLMERRFLAPSGDILIEDFDADWRPRGGPDQIFEPGHHFEWAWLLRQYEMLGGRSAERVARRLWSTAVLYGTNAAVDVFDFASPHETRTRRSVRLWPHTEAARAALLGFSHAGSTLSDEIMARVASRFLVEGKGLWRDRLDAGGRAVSSTVPASSLYHLCSAIDARENHTSMLARPTRKILSTVVPREDHYNSSASAHCLW